MRGGIPSKWRVSHVCLCFDQTASFGIVFSWLSLALSIVGRQGEAHFLLVHRVLGSYFVATTRIPRWMSASDGALNLGLRP